MTWTHFWDMHSGGGSKEPQTNIFIEAPEAEAKVIFYNRFGHNSERITCTCCGEDYSIQENDTLQEATAYYRGCEFDKAAGNYVEQPSNRSLSMFPYTSLEDYIKLPHVLVIYAADIKPEERVGEVPAQGYIWVD